MAYKRNRFGSIVLKGDDGKEFTVTKKEQEQLKVYVKRANQRRLDKARAYYKDVKNQPNMKGISHESYMHLLTEKNFITERYSTSLKQFKSKDDVKDLLKELKAVTKRGYGNKRLDDIRSSMNRRLIETYGENDSRMLREQISTITNAELLTIYLHNDEIVKTIYGSDITEEQVTALLTKTESDINFYLNRMKMKMKRRR